MKIQKIERTDKDIDNSRYIITTYENIIDDEGTSHLIAKNTERPCAEYDAEILARKESIQAEIDKLQDQGEIEKKIAELEAQKTTVDSTLQELNKLV